MNIKLNPRRQERYERALLTVRHVVASPRVKQFCIGITGNPTSRKKAYQRWAKKDFDGNLDGFVPLDWGLSCDEALRFEKWLFESAKSHSKYVNSERVRYFGSVNRSFENHYIYLAWWSPAYY
jgi:hypothetical protein